MKLSANVIYCDNHLLVCFKPSGWATQEELESFAKEWVKQKFEKPGAVFLHCIHRLDRPVSGLVIFAKTSKALSRLNEASREGKIRRFYVAEVESILPEKKGTLRHFLLHGEHRAIVDSSGKEALLTFAVQQFREHSTLVRIELQTGRYHQIRAQFAAIGHPVVGDRKYGAKESFDEIHLACTELIFSHPVTQEELTFRIDPSFA